MEGETYTLVLREKINIRRTRLNNMVNQGIDENVIIVSQELDELITEYTKLQLASKKNGSF